MFLGPRSGSVTVLWLHSLEGLGQARVSAANAIKVPEHPPTYNFFCCMIYPGVQRPQPSREAAGYLYSLSMGVRSSVGTGPDEFS